MDSEHESADEEVETSALSGGSGGENSLNQCKWALLTTSGQFHLRL